MDKAVRLHTTVLAGGRIDVTAPELDAGQQVEVIFLAAGGTQPKLSMLDFMRSFKPPVRTAADWQRIDREFQEERDAWDH